MAIEPNDITTDLTIELDEEEISIADFSNAFEHFFGLVKELTKTVVPDKTANGWLVKVYPGSAGVGVFAKKAVYLESEVAAIRKNCIDGLRQLESGSRPQFFTDKAIEHSREISKVFSSKKGAPNLRIWSKHDVSYSVPRSISLRASEILDAVYEDDGSVEGILEKLSAHRQLEFVIYNSLDNRAIKCEIDEKQLPTALEAFRKRVEVMGRVRYRKDGRPVSVKAKEILAYPTPEEIPTLEEIRKILS